MVRFALILLVCVVGLAGPAAGSVDTTAVGSQVGSGGSAVDVVPLGAPSLVIGDSISYGARHRIQRLLPSFRVDALRGRLVTTSTIELESQLAANGVPRELVVELGTNTMPGWTEQDYQHLVDLLPRTTQVIFVAPYVRPNDLDPSLPRGSLAAARTYLYAAWLYQIAATNENVCVDPWRSMVIRHPGLLGSDGVHPTHPAGREAFAELLATTVRSSACQGYRLHPGARRPATTRTAAAR